EGRAVILAGLGIGAEGTGIVVADHDDEAGAEDGEERPEARRPALARRDVAMSDGAEGAADLAEMSLVKRRGARSGIEDFSRGHRNSPESKRLRSTESALGLGSYVRRQDPGEKAAGGCGCACAAAAMVEVAMVEVRHVGRTDVEDGGHHLRASFFKDRLH